MMSRRRKRECGARPHILAAILECSNYRWVEVERRNTLEPQHEVDGFGWRLEWVSWVVE
jgi:hypothetical protein